MEGGREDGVVQLADGRALGFAEYGDAQGVPAMFFHGSPGSRYGAALLDAAAKAHGVRLFSPDRPGYGLSDLHPGRKLLDWPRDVVELGDILGLGRFAVAGVSAGGPYACACAFAIPERLRAAVLISSGGIPDLPGVWDNMMRINRVGFRLARHAPWALSLLMRPLAKRAREDPERAVKPAERGMAEQDRLLLGRPEIKAAAAREFREAFRQGHRGAAQDISVISRAWGFALAGVRMKVHVWHGEDDRNASPTTAHHMARVLPDCEARFFPGEGHSHWIPRADELMALIAAQG